MTATVTLTLVDGVKIVVPNSIELITPYVLFEQQDWFEDEIKFLRRLLQSGQKVIDIGANYGAYTFSMAQKVGITGNVWSFEPASSTAKLLAEGISANGFNHIVLEQSALSNVCGTAQLSLNENSKPNALIHEESSSTSNTESVALHTIDECLEQYSWQNIAFMKIDAEEEYNILQGGKRFFAEMSQPIQYEIKAGSVAVNARQQLGKTVSEKNQMNLSEPFLATGVRFDFLSPNQDIGRWVLASILEKLERLRHYSSFYTDVSNAKKLGSYPRFRVRQC